VVVYTCNPNTWEAEARGLGDGGKPWLYGETLSQQNETKKGGN
jgi:hypothetical protein